MGGERRDAPGSLRLLGAVALLVVGAVHIDQYFAVHYNVVPVIGTLFLLNLIGAGAIALFLILPTERLLSAAVARLAALAGIGLAACSGAFLLVSEHTTLFGFVEHGYRTAIVVTLVAEAATVVLLGTHLVALVRRPRDAEAAVR